MESVITKFEAPLRHLNNECIHLLNEWSPLSALDQMDFALSSTFERPGMFEFQSIGFYFQSIQ